MRGGIWISGWNAGAVDGLFAFVGASSGDGGPDKVCFSMYEGARWEGGCMADRNMGWFCFFPSRMVDVEFLIRDFLFWPRTAERPSETMLMCFII